jgi:hypothetical protein
MADRNHTGTVEQPRLDCCFTLCDNKQQSFLPRQKSRQNARKLNTSRQKMAARFALHSLLLWVPLPVQFTSPGVESGTNPITHWNWTFGDGSTSTAQKPSHIYASAGTFYPSLVATNNLGSHGYGLRSVNHRSGAAAETDHNGFRNKCGIDLAGQRHRIHFARHNEPWFIDGLDYKSASTSCCQRAERSDQFHLRHAEVLPVKPVIKEIYQ